MRVINFIAFLLYFFLFLIIFLINSVEIFHSFPHILSLLQSVCLVFTFSLSLSVWLSSYSYSYSFSLQHGNALHPSLLSYHLVHSCYSTYCCETVSRSVSWMPSSTLIRSTPLSYIIRAKVGVNPFLLLKRNIKSYQTH